MRSPSTFLLALFLLAAGCVPAFGQEQEQKLAARLLKPNMNKSYLSQHDFAKAKTYDTKAANSNSYVLREKFQAKEFISGTYVPKKGFWMGDFKFKTASADAKGKGQTERIVKPFAVKSAAAKNAPEAKKDYKVSKYETKTSRYRGASQDRFDRQGPGALASHDAIGWHGANWQGGIDRGDTESRMAPMSIDEVRDLLNKNK